jgi:hypothetical protein
MVPDVDFSKSLQELEGADWGEPTYPSRLVIECHRLRRVPLNDLTPDNLRMLIGQEIGLAYLVPRALTLLAADPLLEEDYGYYPGDLLWVVLTLPTTFWQEHDGWRSGWLSIAVAARARCDEIAAQSEVDWQVTPVQPDVVKAINRFLADTP